MNFNLFMSFYKCKIGSNFISTIAVLYLLGKAWLKTGSLSTFSSSKEPDWIYYYAFSFYGEMLIKTEYFIKSSGLLNSHFIKLFAIYREEGEDWIETWEKTALFLCAFYFII